MNNLVSFLISVYNTPVAYFRQAVDSMLDQSYEYCEIVLVNDGSDDAELLDYINDLDCKYESLTVIHNGTNLGLTKSLNIGLEYCKGKYIARMDADDICLKDRISKQVQYMEAHPAISLVGSGVISIGSCNANDGSINAMFNDIELYRIYSLLRHSGPPHPTFMFKADYLEKHGIRYREDIIKAQDYGIMVDILKGGGEIRCIREPLLKYRIHERQITSTGEIEQKAYQCRVSYDYIRLMFPDLNEEECAAISLLGCKASWRALIATVCNNESLKRTCGFIVDHIDSLADSKVYINAIKKALMYNDRIRVFTPDKLRMVLRYELWKKAVRMSSDLHRVWSQSLYTLSSYYYVIKKRHENGYR